MTAEQTLDNRRAVPEHPEDTRIVAVDIETGAMAELPAGPGVKFNPSILGGDVVAYIRRDGDERGIHYSNGTRGPAGDIRVGGVVARWHAGRLSQAGDVPAQAVGEDLEPQSAVRVDADERRSVVQSDG